MTDQEINIAIAEACGVVCDRCGGTGKYERYGKHEWFRMNMGSKLSDELRFAKCDHITEDEYAPFCKLYPNYCHDLNAMHEAIDQEIVGFAPEEKRFIKELNAILDRRADDDATSIFEYEVAQIQSSALELAEAFLRVKGLWKE